MDNFWVFLNLFYFFFFFNFYHILNFSIHLNFYSHRSNLVVFYCVLYISLKSPLGTWNKRMYVCGGINHALEKPTNDNPFDSLNLAIDT